MASGEQERQEQRAMVVTDEGETIPFDDQRAFKSYVDEKIRNFSRGQNSSDPTGEDDNTTYNFTYPKRGLAVLINNIHFSRNNVVNFSGFGEQRIDRGGAEKDGDALFNSLRKAHFDIVYCLNLTHKDMAHVLVSASAKYNHASADCFVCVIMTHGGYENKDGVYRDVMYAVNWKQVSVHAVTKSFDDIACPGLKGKPRLFFFQMCRGLKDDTSVQTTERVVTKPQQDMSGERREIPGLEPDAGELSLPLSVPLYKDYLMMYATSPGYSSWITDSGTWFIKSLCQVLEREDICRISLLSALTKVCGMVARDCATKKKELKQMPVIQSMLVKDILFTPKPPQTNP